MLKVLIGVFAVALKPSRNTNILAVVAVLMAGTVKSLIIGLVMS